MARSVAAEEMDNEDLMADALVVIKCSCFVDVFHPALLTTFYVEIFEFRRGIRRGFSIHYQQEQG